MYQILFSVRQFSTKKGKKFLKRQMPYWGERIKRHWLKNTCVMMKS